MRRPVVCSIGSSDPWNAAGIGLDIRALAACGARAVTVVAGVTAQDRSGVHAAAAVASDLIAAQLRALAGAQIAVYRVGALLDVASVEVVAAHLASVESSAVYDPVLTASGGGTFATASVRAAIVARLLPQASIVTPNLDEAAALSGMPAVRDASEMERAARALLAAGARAVLVKGGHLGGDPVDLFVDGREMRRYGEPRLSGELRGTGCLLACGIAAALAHGAPLADAIVRGRGFVRECFGASVETGGMRVAY